MAPASHFTPVKVRGKRRGCSAEKWRTGKRRTSDLRTRRSNLDLATTNPSRASSSRPRKRRRQDDFESPLEALPAEILQEIFEIAGNVDLAIVSHQLASKLSKSQHLQNELTTRLLEPVLNKSQSTPASADLRAATRVLNSRFMTWDFFKKWMKTYANAAASLSPDHDVTNWQQLWHTLQPSSELLPPKKLLSPPFTEAKVNFLSVLAQSITNVHALNAACAELAQESIVQAVNDGNLELVSLLLRIGVRATTELLRVAVADSGCHQKIVEMLIGPSGASDRPGTASSHGHSTGNAIDVLDPVLWQWAERAQKQGNSKGKWLIARLREEQRRREHRSTPVPSL